MGTLSEELLENRLEAKEVESGLVRIRASDKKEYLCRRVTPTEKEGMGKRTLAVRKESVQDYPIITEEEKGILERRLLGRLEKEEKTFDIIYRHFVRNFRTRPDEEAGHVTKYYNNYFVDFYQIIKEI